jgi:hypothetical protein
VLAVVRKFGEARANVLERRVVLVRLVEYGPLWTPRSHEDLEARYVDLSVMQVSLEARHVPRQETAILVNGVSRQDALAEGNVPREQLERLAFCVFEGNL